MRTLILRFSRLITCFFQNLEIKTCFFQNLEIKNLHHQFLHFYNSTSTIVPTYPKLVSASLVVCKSFILSQRVCEVDPPCYVTVDVSTVKNGKYYPSCYNVTSATHFKVCKFLVCCQMVYEIIPIHVDVVHVTTNVTVKHWCK